MNNQKSKKFFINYKVNLLILKYINKEKYLFIIKEMEKFFTNS